MSLRTALEGLTTRGRCLLAAGLALVGCGVVLGTRDLLRAGVFLVALPVVAVAVVSRTRYRLACERVLDPPRVEVGRPTDVRLRLDNVSRLPTGTLLVEDGLPWVLGGRPRFVVDRLEPKGRREASYAVRSDVRGRFTIGPLAVRLADPFGLCELSRSFTATSDLVVTPVVTPLPPVRLGGDWAAGGESSSKAVAASGADDVATREYRQGDDLRKVHWRSTARTGELMVRREEQPFQSRAVLLLDGRLDAHRGEGPGSSFEWSVSAVASIGASLVRSGTALHVVREDGSEVTAAGVPTTEGLLLDSLAVVQPQRDGSLQPAISRLRRGVGEGVVVAVVGMLSDAEAEQLARLRAASGPCVAVVVDTDSWAPVSPKARAAAQRRHTRVQTLLAGSGWRVVPVSHGTTLASVWPLAGVRLGAVAAAPPAAPRPEVVA